MMSKLKIDLTFDEIELLRYIIFKSTDFRAFNTKIFLNWMNSKRYGRLKELIKIQAPETKIFPEKKFPDLLKQLITICYKFGTTFVISSLKPFLYESN